ncbi:MAG: isoprenyl transferase [Desulfuromonadaceae bacterium]|nr:isoprenyl transferase [Desulfuromonadaceae bacterium]
MDIPYHLAIIMDGNGRWAEKRMLPRIAGHREGAKSVRRVVEECRRLGVGYLTLYAFSTENWGRPRGEVEALMRLLEQFLREETPQMVANGIRFNVIGDMQRLPEAVRQEITAARKKTADCHEMVLTLALSYGGRDEIARAARRLAVEIEEGRLDSQDIDENTFSGRLDTADLPDPDLLIRTSGEKRISNFLLWQLAYSELVFSEAHWPEFGGTELRAAFEEFSRRKRRFGLLRAKTEKGLSVGGR